MPNWRNHQTNPKYLPNAFKIIDSKADLEVSKLNSITQNLRWDNARLMEENKILKKEVIELKDKIVKL